MNGEDVSGSSRAWTAWFGWRSAVLSAVALACIVALFLFFGGEIEARVLAVLSDPRSQGWIAGLTTGLLALDIVFPMPASVITVTAGASLGWLGGTIAAGLGLSIGCLIGYGVGRWFGAPFIERFVTEDERRGLDLLMARWGGLGLILTRPIPVLGEASVLLAGASRACVRRTIAATTFANLAVAAIYAGFGALSEGVGSMALAFAAAMLTPVVVALVARAAGLRF